MNQKQCFAAAAKLLGGSKVGIRTDETALVGEERQLAIEAARRARDLHAGAVKMRDDIRAAILAADPAYQDAVLAARDAEKAMERARGRAHARRIVILRLGGLFNVIEAEGDTHADAIDQLKHKKGGCRP